MELERAENLADALKRQGIPAYAQYTGGGIFLAEVDLGDGTLLQIGEDESTFGWQRTDGETGELVGESTTTPGEYGDLSSQTDPSNAAEQVRRLIETRRWTPVER
jgi:hypothetical protein